MVQSKITTCTLGLATVVITLGNLASFPSYMYIYKERKIILTFKSMDDNCGEWVESMGVVIRRWVWLAGGGCG